MKKLTRVNAQYSIIISDFFTMKNNRSILEFFATIVARLMLVFNSNINYLLIFSVIPVINMA